MLDILGLGTKWCNWINACISNVSFATMMNGGLSEFFKTFRGLRQGDPLSPLLFIVVKEVLNKLLTRAREADLFNGVVC